MKKVNHIRFILILFGLVIFLILHTNEICNAHENESVNIKILTDYENNETVGVVLENGNEFERNRSYLLKIKNIDLKKSRNVTIIYNWTVKNEAWNIYIYPKNLVLNCNESKEINVSVQSNFNMISGKKTKVKIFALEYETNTSEPSDDDKNTTNGVIGGSVIITTKIISHYLEYPVVLQLDNKSSYFSNPNTPNKNFEVFSYNLTILNPENKTQKFKLSTKIYKIESYYRSMPVVFYPSNITDFIEPHQKYNVTLEIIISKNTVPGNYTLKIYALGVNISDSLNFNFNTSAPDLCIKELYFNRSPIIYGQELILYVNICNYGGKLTNNFTIDFIHINSSGARKLIDKLNIITGLKYFENMTIFINYDVEEEGYFEILVMLDTNNDTNEIYTDNSFAFKANNLIYTSGRYSYKIIDTDNDGIINSVDSDDDNDGISDSDELEGGTDPLDPDNNKNKRNLLCGSIIFSFIFILLIFLKFDIKTKNKRLSNNNISPIFKFFYKNSVKLKTLLILFFSIIFIISTYVFINDYGEIKGTLDSPQGSLKCEDSSEDFYTITVTKMDPTTGVRGIPWVIKDENGKIVGENYGPLEEIYGLYDGDVTYHDNDHDGRISTYDTFRHAVAKTKCKINNKIMRNEILIPEITSLVGT